MRAERDQPISGPRTAIVTDGALGIGGAISRELGRQGYAVSISYVGSAVETDATLDAIQSSRGAALAVRADLADELDVERLFTETTKAFFAVDVVVHGLSVAADRELGLRVATRRARFRALRLVNREAGRRLRAGGAVVNLCGLTDTAGTEAVARATRALSRELHDRDITVNAVAAALEDPERCTAAVAVVAFLVGESGHRINGRVIRLDEPGSPPGVTPGATGDPGREGPEGRPTEVTMSTTDASSDRRTAEPEEHALDLRLEVVVLPVADVDRAKDFYTKALRCRLDADFSTEDSFRVVQVTPPGSSCSIIFGKGLTSATPGATRDLMFVVDDIEQAHDDLAAQGVEVSDVFHDVGGVFHHAGTEGRVPGPDPERRSYCSFVSFDDPDGNGWVIQEITTRLPGR